MMRVEGEDDEERVIHGNVCGAIAYIGFLIFYICAFLVSNRITNNSSNKSPWATNNLLFLFHLIGLILLIFPAIFYVVIAFRENMKNNRIFPIFELVRRHVNINPICLVCKGAPETTLHILVRCLFAQNCWSGSRVAAVGAAAMIFSSWFDEGLRHWEAGEITEVVMMCWSIWHHRNQLVWMEKQPTVDDVILFAKLSFEEWSNAQKLSIVTNLVSRQVEIEHWTKPLYPRIKVNVDGAVFMDSRRFGYGCVARDSLGAVVKAKRGSREGVFEPLLVEAMSIKEALSWIKDHLDG
ncbi:hypothetical protein CsatB_011920 [Cannabis sativa]